MHARCPADAARVTVPQQPRTVRVGNNGAECDSFLYKLRGFLVIFGGFLIKFAGFSHQICRVLHQFGAFLMNLVT